MPATLIDENRSEVLDRDASPMPASFVPPPASRTLSAPSRPPLSLSPPSRALPSRAQPSRPLPSRRRRRVTGRLARLAALLAMGAWVALGLMPILAVLLAAYGS